MIKSKVSVTMNAFQNCRNTSDAIPLYLPQQLYLKPIARLNISLQLPQKTMGKSISNWEVMEQLRYIIKPEEFSILKVTKTNLEFIRFEAEIEDKNKLEKIIAKLNNKMIKLKEFPEFMRLRASETKSNFPTRHTWDSYFREAKNMNEMKPGERPDTVHISNLPIKWFVPYHLTGEENVKPSEKIFFRVFEKFGHIRRIDIPICDPYRSKMKAEVSGMQMFSFNEEHFFEGYVQFKDYVGFTKTMDAFRGMKLLHKEDEEAYTVSVNVDFDKTKHLSDASVRRREIVRDRLVRKEIDREEKVQREKEEEELKIQAERQKETDEKAAKEKRRRDREEKRKAKILAKLKVTGADEINEKIAKEEKKLLKVQRKLEAIRLVEELFRRIKIKKEKDLSANVGRKDEDELTRLKNSSEIEVHQQREKLNRAIEGRVVLKSILSGGPRIRSFYDDSSSSSDSSVTREKPRKKKESTSPNAKQFDPNYHPADAMLAVGDWYGYPPNGVYPYQMPPVYPALRGHPSTYLPYPPRGRGIGRGVFPGPSRGLPNLYPRRSRGTRYRGSFRGAKSSLYPPELQEQYYRYFEKFLHEHDDRSNRSYSRSRSRSHSRRRSSSRRSRSRSRRRDRSRSHSQHRSREHKSRSRSRSRSKTRKSSRTSRSKSYSRTNRKSRSRSRHSRSHRSSRSRHSSPSQRTPPLKRSSRHRSERRSRSSRTKSKERIKSRSPSYRSIDSSKFISPSRLRMPRSKSWSLPRENDNNKRSWSKSASPEIKK